jgi:hypothetical protein
MRTLIAIMIVELMASSTAFARNASHHHSKRAAALKHQLTFKQIAVAFFASFVPDSGFVVVAGLLLRVVPLP